jgi:hypothetical protein
MIQDKKEKSIFECDASAHLCDRIEFDAKGITRRGTELSDSYPWLYHALVYQSF